MPVVAAEQVHLAAVEVLADLVAAEQVVSHAILGQIMELQIPEAAQAELGYALPRMLVVGQGLFSCVIQTHFQLPQQQGLQHSLALAAIAFISSPAPVH